MCRYHYVATAADGGYNDVVHEYIIIPRFNKYRPSYELVVMDGWDHQLLYHPKLQSKIDSIMV